MAQLAVDVVGRLSIAAIFVLIAATFVRDMFASQRMGSPATRHKTVAKRTLSRGFVRAWLWTATEHRSTAARLKSAAQWRQKRRIMLPERNGS
jgi:hypothetical protein